MMPRFVAAPDATGHRDPQGGGWTPSRMMFAVLFGAASAGVAVVALSPPGMIGWRAQALTGNTAADRAAAATGGAAAGSAAAGDAAVARLEALEQRVRTLEAALGARGDEIARAVALAVDSAGALGRQDGFVAALLNLQTAIATSRPWQRELRAALEMDNARQIAAPVREVLLSHSQRGVPTEAELRERFLALASAIAWRTSSDGDLLDRASLRVRSALAGLGLVAPPPPGPAEAVVASISDRIRRGDLAGAVADASSLDKRVEPLLAGWSAQARARLAVEQAVRESILSALARGKT